MFVQPNTPALVFSPADAFDTATRDELEVAIADLVRMAGWVSIANEEGAGQLFQAAASLRLLLVFSFGRSLVPANVRRELRTLRRARSAMVAWSRRFPHLVLSCIALLFVACADVKANNHVPILSGDDEPPASELEPAGELEQPQAPELEPTDAPAVDAPEPVRFLELDGAACTGHWVESDDVGTRLQAHPDTGVCTLPCQIVGPQRNTCTPEHRAHLAALCAELGGACHVARDGLSYCEAL